MRINTNVSALNTHRVLGQTNTEAARSIGRLSSGFRINRAADDAAGLAIANKFRADIRSLKVAQQNTTEATSMLQVAEGNTTTISNILGRMKELSTQASSYNASSQLTTLNDEFSALKGEIDRIVGGATYQGVALLDGSFDGTFQIGATNDVNNQLGISLGNTGGAVSKNYTGSDLNGLTLGGASVLGNLDGAYSISATKTTGTGPSTSVDNMAGDTKGLTNVNVVDGKIKSNGLADGAYSLTVEDDGTDLIFTLTNADSGDTWTAKGANDGTGLTFEFYAVDQDNTSDVILSFDIADAADFVTDELDDFASEKVFDVATTAGTSDKLKFEIKDKGGVSVASGEQNLPASGNVSFDVMDASNNSLAKFSIDAATFDATTFGSQTLFTVDAANPTNTGLSTADLGLDTIDLTTGANAQSALTAIDSAIDTVNSFLGKIGATQNRLDYASANIATTIENYSASESAIRDADMAYEMVNFTRNQIMQQAATAMLAQANAAPQGVLRLLS